MEDMQSSVSLITAYCTNTNNQYLIRDWSLIIIMGGGGGLQHGKIAAAKPFVCPPRAKVKPFVPSL